ncbi:DUF2169 domain-containing protein [Archangium sp.]|uniref:DUF2169 domain-containing protein n=1 Tax=Archangium sp. TaxID=1872627 RepID=UPI002D3C6A0A|nr:DUF2169 domain-containing protein [Archangium sp.]HYO51754.1 DUF2169 domain-containing protein [Archangium sp.]
MQIGSNTTGLAAGLCVAIDKTGRERCVVVVKGTFLVGADRRTQPADMQEPLLYVDTHFGEPGASSPRDECDFAPVKPRADILVRGTPSRIHFEKTFASSPLK